jgi:hypothetical protein
LKCNVEGCERDAKAKGLCNMHYQRHRRQGTTDRVRAPGPDRYEDVRGYQFLRDPTHPLKRPLDCYVAEHRAVLYAAIGPDPMCCELCDKPLTWKTCAVDHIDENPRNNERANLRPLCARCNMSRNLPPAVEHYRRAIPITFGGETKTSNEWARDPRVSISSVQIRNRKRQGMSDEDALFAPKQSHNGNKRRAASNSKEAA